MSETLFQKQLEKFGACREARGWVGERNARQAWDECERPDWLLWLAGRIGVDRKLLVLAACACARTALKFVPVGEDHPRLAIETAEAWTRGEASIDDVSRARADAWEAWRKAPVPVNAYADAAYAYTDAASYAAADAAYAAASAAYAAYADAADAAAAARRECSRLIRQHISFGVVREASRGK